MRQISSIAPLVITAALLAACNQQKPDAGTRADSATSVPAPASAATQPKPRATVEMLEFHADSIPPDYFHDGRITTGARWMDANGENTLIVSEREIQLTGDLANERRQQIFACLYVADSGGGKLLWKIFDSADNLCDKGAGLLSKIIVRDLNNDGVAENAFVYNVQGSCDVSPIPIKLMLHSGNDKYAVRGSTEVRPSMEPGSEPIGGEKKFDPAFNTAPPEFRTFADDLWKETVK